MARSRNIKPGFFTNDDLVELPALTRLLFIGLWCIADRAGRLEDRPKKIKMEILPADDIDVDAALEALAPTFLTRYQVDGKKYIQINNFLKHQKPHVKESASVIPPPPCENRESTDQEQCLHLPRQVQVTTLAVDSTDQESLIPDSLLLIPDCKSSFAAVPAGTPAPRKPSRKPPSFHAWFSGWFPWSFRQITGAPYAYNKADAGIIKGLLGSLKPDELVNRAVYYLLLPDDQRFPRGSPTLKGLAHQINQIAGKDSEETDRRAIALGILPEPGGKLNNFTPWKIADNQPPSNLKAA